MRTNQVNRLWLEVHTKEDVSLAEVEAWLDTRYNEAWFYHAHREDLDGSEGYVYEFWAFDLAEPTPPGPEDRRE